MTVNAITNGVAGSLKIVGMFRSNTKWPKNMITYADTKSAERPDRPERQQDHGDRRHWPAHTDVQEVIYRVLVVFPVT